MDRVRNVSLRLKELANLKPCTSGIEYPFKPRFWTPSRTASSR